MTYPDDDPSLYDVERGPAAYQGDDLSTYDEWWHDFTEGDRQKEKPIGWWRRLIGRVVR